MTTAIRNLAAQYAADGKTAAAAECFGVLLTMLSDPDDANCSGKYAVAFRLDELDEDETERIEALHSLSKLF